MTTQQRLTRISDLNGHHRHTYDAIFRHPAAHNLEWHDIRSLLDALLDVDELPNGTIKATQDHHQLILHVPKHKDIATVEDLVAIRHFLKQLDLTEDPSPVASGIHLVVLIDHHEAKVYRTESHGAVPQRLVPYDPRGFGRHLRSENPETDGKHKSEQKTFYEAIAATLRDAEQILIFGDGTGASSAMEHLLAVLNRDHRDLAGRIVGSIIIDAHHVTDSQLLARARSFFGSEDDPR